MSTTSKGKSGYARHGKAPYKYSEHYHRWASAVATHGFLSEEAQAADRTFRRVFNVPATGNRRDLSGDVL